MFDKQTSRVETKCLRLCFGGVNKGHRCDKHTGKAAAFKVGDVMHTA